MISYFVRRLYFFLFCFFLLVIGVLSFGDLLVRLTLLPSLGAIPVIFVLMIPLMSIFAIPLATSIGTHVLVGKLCDNNEVLLSHFLPRLKRALFISVGIFSLSIMVLYVPLVCEWAPRTYFRGKKFMVMLAQERLLQLEPGKFHSFLGAFSLYFQYKDKADHFGRGSHYHYFNGHLHCRTGLSVIGTQGGAQNQNRYGHAHLRL